MAVWRDGGDPDYSGFVKLCAEVITRLTEKVQTFLSNGESGCKLRGGDAARPLMSREDPTRPFPPFAS